jgi:biotin carboxylase
VKEWLILVESNTSGTGRLFGRAAKSIGYRPVVLAEDPLRYPYLQEEGFDFLQLKTGDYESLLTTIEGLAKKAPIAGISTSSEYFAETAAELAHKYGLPGANPLTIGVCRNKYNQRLRLRQNGVLVPGFQSATSYDQAIDALGLMRLPVVVKPTRGSGSVGVRLCRTVEEVSGHATFLMRQSVDERGVTDPREILVEEYLEGTEYSVETFGCAVVGITRKHLSTEPWFVEIGHDYPATLSGPLTDQIASTARRALETMGMFWGPAHVEIRLTAKGPAVIEINPRLAGGFIPELVRLASGIDLIRESIRLAAGGTPDILATRQGRASIRFVLAPMDGIISRIDGLEKAAQIPGVADVQTYRKVGERIHIRHDFRDRVGHAISSSDVGERAAESAQRACDEIGVKIAPLGALG